MAHKRAVRRVNVSVAIVMLLIGHESLLVASALQMGEKPSSTFQQRNNSELASGAVAEWMNFYFADLFPASKGESKAADKALQAEIDTLKHRLACKAPPVALVTQVPRAPQEAQVPLAAPVLALQAHTQTAQMARAPLASLVSMHLNLQRWPALPVELGAHLRPLPQAATSAHRPVTGAFTAVSVGQVAACAVASTGSITCWRKDDYQQISTKPATGVFTALSEGRAAACALNSTASITCWGSDQYQQTSSQPVTGAFTALSVGFIAACAVASDGSITCWGNDSSDIIRQRPLTGAFTAVSVGLYAACALASDGSIACWGTDVYLQISKRPTSGAFTAVSVGFFAACALDSTGSITCWGNDSAKQITHKPTSGTFTAVSVGLLAACALDSIGSITCWGDDSANQISNEPEYCF
ncbi:g10728 [Coccomyxa elongata]